MTRCTVCTHPERGTIDALIAAQSARSVASQYGLAARAVQRHAARHRATLPATDAPPADPLDELVHALRARALAGSDPASREYRLALQAQQAARNAAAPTRPLEAEPEWLALRAALVAALAPFPEARQAVADAIGGFA